MIDELRRALQRMDLSETERAKLEHVQALLDADPQAHLAALSFIADEPYATIEFGDTASAELIVLLTHGTETDLALLPRWADIARRLCADVIRSCVARGEPRRVATVAWFGWDSGSHATVLSTAEATIGAAQLAAEIDRLKTRSPSAQIAVIGYSYSATLIGELFAFGLADDVSFVATLGGAGVTQAGEVALAEAIADGSLTMYATEAAADAVAPLGRLGRHPIDTRDVAGVIGFDSDGGDAPSPDGEIVVGLAVGGHGARTESDAGDARIGYFDPRSQAYLQLVSYLAGTAC